MYNFGLTLFEILKKIMKQIIETSVGYTHI